MIEQWDLLVPFCSKEHTALFSTMCNGVKRVFKTFAREHGDTRSEELSAASKKLTVMSVEVRLQTDTRLRLPCIVTLPEHVCRNSLCL